MSDYPYTPPPPPYQQPVPQNSQLALFSLIAGIVGLFLIPVVGSIIAVVLGHMAKGEIGRSGGTLGGSGMATWGLILGYGGLVLYVCGGLSFFVICPLLGVLPFLFAQPTSWLLPLLAV